MILIVSLHLIGVTQQRDIESFLNHGCSQNPTHGLYQVEKTAKVTEQVEDFVRVEAVQILLLRGS